MLGKKIVPIFVLLLAMLLVGCTEEKEEAEKQPSQQSEQTPQEKVELPMFLAGDFAVYEDIPVNELRKVNSYVVEPGLSNVINPEMFQFSESAERLLIENGFVVIPGGQREFFMLYEMNRYQPVPNFITTDSMLHNYHLFFNHLLRTVEKEELTSFLRELTASMFSESEEQHKALEGTPWENAAKRNLGFFTVAGKLLDLDVSIPEAVRDEVEEELQLIESTSGITPSPIMNMGQDLNVAELLMEDYSQYIPRGHYADDEVLQKYFRTMMWFGRMTFRADNEDETKSALLMTLALSKGDNGENWDKIYQPTSFFVGKADDLSFLHYRDLVDEIYGSTVGLKDVPMDSENWDSFMDAVSKLDPPIINSIPIFEEDIQPDREKAVKGFRFIGQRFTLDAEIFQRLLYRDVKENNAGERRMLPKALDIPAAMGSEEAYMILEAEGETEYAGYPENMGKLKEYIGNLDKNTWTQNLYWNWLYTLDSLLDERREGDPFFMQNKAWLRKDLNTFLGSWTELKHDTILYAKQVYAEMGGGMDDIDDRGYVEPNPTLYARLAALVKMTKEGLASRELLNERDSESLDRLKELALSLKTISEKELSNQSLSDEEYDLIRSYGGQLEHFWMEALRDIGVDHPSALAENPAALIADVATDPNGQVLEEGTGHIFEIYAVVPVDGSLRIAKGGVYSHYEFPWPLNDRLTDKKWHEMLDAGQEPALASWTDAYIAP